jgi:pimeloyl-ACP methyl ester carboxylesterase
MTYEIDTVAGLRVGRWSAGPGSQGPLVVAAHGITSSHLAWTLVGPRLAADHRFIGVDLRGRGGSRDLPGPYGMAAHADDLAAVIIAAGGGPAILVGHSMGGFVVAETARRHPELVARLVLVDGGAPLPVPPGIDPSGDPDQIAPAIRATVGAAFARLEMAFPTVEAYRELWQAHPSFQDWTPACDEYIEYDLTGSPPELRPACRLEAALRDARDLYAFTGVEPSALPRPAVFLRAERGMLNQPDLPFYQPGYAAQWLPGTAEQTVPDTNHYTITLGVAGATAIAAAVRTG